MAKDLEFNARLISYLFALEVQDMIQNGRENELQDLQEAYSIPQERAAVIIEVAAKRYLNQLLNLAFRGAKRYDEKDTVVWLREIVKYTQFISEGGRVDCDGNLFSEKDKERLISYYENMMMTPDISSEDESKVRETCEELRRIIQLTESYVAPLSGIQGLLGGMVNLNDLMVADPSENRKRWAWG